MGDDSQIPTEGRGSVRAKHDEFKNVLYVPSLAANTLSVYHMAHTGSPKRVTFNSDSVEITEKSTGKLVEKGIEITLPKLMSFHISYLFLPLQLYCLMLTTPARFGMRYLAISISNI